MGLKESGLRGSLRSVSTGVRAIPDSVVDDYEWGGPVGNRYSALNGTLDSWDINQNPPIREGDYSLKFSQAGSESQSLTSDENDGLDYYPDADDAIWTWVRFQNDGANPLVGFLLSDGQRARDGVGFQWRGTDDIIELRLDGNITSENLSPSTGTWFLITLDLNDNNGDLEAQLVVYNGPTTNDDVLADLTDTDTNSDLIGRRGVGYEEAGDQEDHVIDRILADIGGGDPNV